MTGRVDRLPAVSRGRSTTTRSAVPPFDPGSLGTVEVTAIARIAAVTASSRDVGEGVEEILDEIATFVDYAAISISVWNPMTRRHSTAVARGYPPDVVDVIDSFWVPYDGILGQTRTGLRRPARWRDTPGYRDSRSAQDYLLPAGYREGMGSSLFDVTGRYTGMLSLDCIESGQPSDAAREALAAVQPMLAGYVDRLRAPLWLTRELPSQERVALVGRSGYVAPIPGRDPGPLLRNGSALVTEVVDIIAPGSASTATFWWQDVTRGWHRVRVTPVPDGALVVTASAPLPYDLSRRELDVLTVLATGASNQEIARRLYLAERTVANHVAVLFAKLGVGARSAAATRSVTEGLTRRPIPGARV